MATDSDHSLAATDVPDTCAAVEGCACQREKACDCGAGQRIGSSRFLSPFKVTLALGLVTLVGSFMVFKPDPQGVLAGDTSRMTLIAPEQLRHVVLGAGIVDGATATGPALGVAMGAASADGWRSLGTLESDGLLIRMEAKENRFGEPLIAYTAIDRTGAELASRVSIEDLRSQFPKLDWDSLTAAGPGHLMLADDLDQR